ncbi:MAG: hypothetical protein JW751_02430 [Polyangiaceae bacterium]|nr:hypothetical protein [Polyangiaceae bacterium]
MSEDPTLRSAVARRERRGGPPPEIDRESCSLVHRRRSAVGVSPQQLEDGRIRLFIEISAEPGTKPAWTTIAVNDGQLIVLPTLLPAPPGKSLAALLRLEVSRSFVTGAD